MSYSPKAAFFSNLTSVSSAIIPHIRRIWDTKIFVTSTLSQLRLKFISYQAYKYCDSAKMDFLTQDNIFCFGSQSWNGKIILTWSLNQRPPFPLSEQRFFVSLKRNQIDVWRGGFGGKVRVFSPTYIEFRNVREPTCHHDRDSTFL